ncbi:MAG: hypothetical protein NC390_02610 [Fusobacterium sp.]|nr:hypothetical protein [Fusobacterium sp.]
MRVENIQFNNIPQMKALPQAGASQLETRSVETSIYGKKGLALPFGCWAKGANAAEDACIVAFRKVRTGRCRKFTEPEIVGFMNELRANPREKNMKAVVDELFMTHKICYEEFGAPLESPTPDAHLIRNYLKVAKNCDEYERLGLIGFTQHELCFGATKPLEALANSTPEQQVRFIKIMNDIPIDIDGTEKAEWLYEDLRHVIYATEDLPKLNERGKLQYLTDVYSDYKRLKADESYENESVKESVVRISRDIVDTMMDVLKI